MINVILQFLRLDRFNIKLSAKFYRNIPNCFQNNRKLPSVYVFSYFPFGFEGRMWDLIVSVPDHCLAFYFKSKVSLFSEFESRPVPRPIPNVI